MKTKKIGKKLTFNKNTVAHLDNGELNAIQGGVLLPTRKGLSCLYCLATVTNCPSYCLIACLETEPISVCC